MSDSASKKDVEDVLSSVRRLVSSDHPRNRRPDVPKGPGALVLTDAQRVERPVSKGHAARSLEDRIAELEAAVSARDDEYEPDGSEDQAQHRPSRIVYTRPPTDSEGASARDNAGRIGTLSLVQPVKPDAPTETEVEPKSAPQVAFRHAARATEQDAPETPDEAPMAEDVQAPPEKAEVHRFRDPDSMLDRINARMSGKGAPAGPGHNGFADRLQPYDPERAAKEAAQALSASDARRTAAAVIGQETGADAGGEGRARILIDDEFEAALTDAVTRSITEVDEASDAIGAEDAPIDTQQDMSEPVDADPAPAPAEADQPSAVTDSAPQEADTPANEVTAPEVAEDQTIPVAPAAPLTAGHFDEDTLRPIVAKLIREELQGELGERITRNVRKLVRREILRALNSREIE